jgi:RNA polymerase sigma factor (sigma-70 family)
VDEVDASSRPIRRAPEKAAGPGSTAARHQRYLAATFEPFYREHMPRLTAFVLSLGADLNEAVGVAQETMLRAYKDWGSIEHPKAWARTVASREYYRRALACHEVPVSQLPEIPGPASDSVIIGEEQEHVLRLLRRLPVRRRQIMAWYYDGYKPAQIAATLGIDPGAVRVSLHKARSALQVYLAEEEGQC